jgi:hypothetical protein
MGQVCSDVRLISNNVVSSLLEDALGSWRWGFEDAVHHNAAEVLLGSFEDRSYCSVGKLIYWSMSPKPNSVTRRLLPVSTYS